MYHKDAGVSAELNLEYTRLFFLEISLPLLSVVSASLLVVKMVEIPTARVPSVVLNTLLRRNTLNRVRWHSTSHTTGCQESCLL